MTRDQLAACIALEKEGLYPVGMPIGPTTPTPGLILFADMLHTRLVLVQPDGIAVDLLAVHAAAEDTCRNWNHYPDRHMKLPEFVGDFGRLVKLVGAIKGRRPTESTP